MKASHLTLLAAAVVLAGASPVRAQSLFTTTQMDATVTTNCNGISFDKAQQNVSLSPGKTTVVSNTVRVQCNVATPVSLTYTGASQSAGGDFQFKSTTPGSTATVPYQLYSASAAVDSGATSCSGTPIKYGATPAVPSKANTIVGSTPFFLCVSATPSGAIPTDQKYSDTLRVVLGY